MSLIHQPLTNSKSNESVRNISGCLTPTIQQSEIKSESQHALEETKLDRLSGSVGGVIGEEEVRKYRNEKEFSAGNNNIATVKSLNVFNITSGIRLELSTPMSPPLSPYRREEIQLVNSEGNNNNSSNNNMILYNNENSKFFERLSFNAPTSIPSQTLKQAAEIKRKTPSIIRKEEFPIDSFIKINLTLKPWNNLSNYKNKIMSFRNQYNDSKSNSSTKWKWDATSAFRIHKDRKPRRKNLTTSTAATASESDTDLDRVRTRRVIRDSTFTTSSNDELITTPKKRKPISSASSLSSNLHPIDESIPDYCPDTSKLPSNLKCLKTEWKGQPMDLSSDPNLSKLHPAEVLLASILRLPCNVYLDSKKRLFFEKVQRLRNGQLFRRTDAQKACRIDVNKASRLFASFEKVGWLKDENFRNFT